MTPARIAEYALAARDYVQKALHVDLDGSVESLAFLDHYVAHVGAVDGAVLALIAAAVGSYFGEVAIAHLGGEWTAPGDDPAEWEVTLAAAPLRFRPVAMAAEAIRQDDLDGYDSSISAPPDLQASLGDALAASGPVEADYYYSLTGRLETLEHAAAILAELRRAQKESAS